MWARVSTYEEPPDRLDDSQRYVRETVLPEARQMQGFRGVYGLADRDTGRTMSITLWDSQDAMRASEADADRLRQEATGVVGGAILDVERFEVAVHELVPPDPRVQDEAALLAQTSKEAGLRKWELVNRRDPDTIEEVFTAGTVSHQPDTDLDGVQQAKQYLTMFVTAFPDLTMTVDDVVAEGEVAVTRWTLRGTHQGETEELGPPTGNKVEFEGLSMHRVQQGRIVEEWERYDNLTMLQQLGLLPEG
jgi:predicted ester cyclase/heme-degrading monooxygenase HmoA